MADLLVNLYAPGLRPATVRDGSIRITRALPPNREEILEFVGEHFGRQWAGECATALALQPVGCFVAVQNLAVIGFACYNATAKGFFGPIGVRQDVRAAGVGGALLAHCLDAMRQDGYGYAIIGGGSDVAGFYQKAAGAVIIEGSEPGIYSRMVGYAPKQGAEINAGQQTAQGGQDGTC